MVSIPGDATQLARDGSEDRAAPERGPPSDREALERLQEVHRAAQEALRSAVRDTTRLTRLLSVLCARAPLELLLDRALSTISELFTSDVVAVFQDLGEGAFAVLAAVGIPEDMIQRPFSAVAGGCLAEAIRTRGPVVAGDALRDPRVDAHLRELELQTVACLPILRADGLPTVMLLARSRSAAFERAELDLLAAMGHRIGLVLEHARAEAHLREAQELLLQSEKLALSGHLVGSMAHELNNPLAAILANLSVLRDATPEIAAVFQAARAAIPVLEQQAGPEAQAAARALARSVRGAHPALPKEVTDILSDLEESAQRIVLLVGSFRTLAAGVPPSEPAAQELDATLAACLAQLPPDTGRPELVHERAGGPPCVAWVARTILEPALLGLLRFLLAPGLRRAGRGRVVIRTELHLGLPSLLVSDESVLLSDEEQRRIFDPCLEEVETSAGHTTVRLSMAATLSHRLLRQAGAEPSITRGPDGRGVRIRIVLPAPPKPSREP
jgi:signal transduction histidine kinase